MKKHVFVVDDVYENIEILSELLSQEGIKVTSASNGRKALIAIPKVQPDLILLDLFMPEIDGFEVCKELKKNKQTQNIPVIFVTAGTNVENIINGFNVGALDYITKPFNPLELITRVNTHIELKRTKEALNRANKQLELKVQDGLEKVKKLSTAIDQSASHVVITDIEGNIEYVNKKFCEVTGYELGEIIGSNPNVLKSGKHSEKFYREFWSTIKSGKVWKGEIINKRKNGELFYEFSTITPIFNNKNEIINFIAIKEDITAKKQAENRIMLVSHLAEEKERSRIAKDIHDSVTPLVAAVKLYIQSLKKQDVILKKDIVFSQIENTLEEAITSLSEVSYNLSPQILHKFGLIKAIKYHVKNISALNDIKICFKNNIRKRLNEKYEITIYRIVTELINNTLKHAEASEILLEFQLNDELKLIYKDDGKGFTKNRSNNITNKMGIFNIESRVRAMDGNVLMKTRKGKGVEFIITIPHNG